MINFSNILFGNSLLARDTAIGNGGEVLSQYLEATREALKDTFNQIDITDNDLLNSICHENLITLPDQRVECKQFIVETKRQMILLNSK